jgi:hypothetical protein
VTGEAGIATTSSKAAEAESAKLAGRKTLEQRIADAQADLKNLLELKRSRDAQAKAENEKAVRRLLTAEGLIALDVETWKAALPGVRKALEAIKLVAA